MEPIKNNLVDFIVKIRDYGLEYVAKRYYSKYKGKVELNNDPQQQGRVKVSVGDLGYLNTSGDVSEAQTLPLFAYPSSQFAGDNYGMYFPPEVGDNIWVWFDHGHPTQPHYSGGWWLNPGEGGAKSSDTSQLPEEFKNSSGIPTTRGIKTKQGHTILFEDDTTDRDTGITLFTAEPGASGAPATRHHTIVMSDRDKQILIKTQLGHNTVYDDNPGTQSIKTTSVYGHTLAMDDVAKTITIKTTLGHQIIFDDTANSITAKTVTGNTLSMSDPLATVSLTTVAGQSLIMNDLTASTTILTPGLVNVAAGGAVTVTAGAAATITAAGAVAVTGSGLALTSSGGAPSSQFASGATSNTFIGLATENYAGALTQTVVGLWNMTATTVNIVSSTLKLGSPAPKFHVVDERFFATFNAHSHPGPGTPPSAAFIVGGAVPTASVSTTNVTAN